MSSQERLLTLIGHLYAAPGSEEQWQYFVHDLCAALGGSAASFISHDLRSGRTNVAITTWSDPATVREYAEHWGPRDPWAAGARRARMGAPGVVLGEELVAHTELQRTAFYNDFARRHDVVRCVVGMVETGPALLSGISVNGTEGHGPFGRDHVALLTALLPHVQRALQLHRRLGAAETAANRLGTALDQASRAVFLVSARGRVEYMNAAAEQLVKARDGIAVDEGDLRASRPSDTSRLRALLADAAATSTEQGLGSGGTLRLGRPSGRRPLTALVSPHVGRRPVRSDLATPVAMVVVSDPDRADVPDAGVLGAILGLTPSEATLVRLLALGVGLEEAAAQLGLRPATLRTRLKGVFEKTDTHRQADLVRLVLNAIPRL